MDYEFYDYHKRRRYLLVGLIAFLISADGNLVHCSEKEFPFE